MLPDKKMNLRRPLDRGAIEPDWWIVKKKGCPFPRAIFPNFSDAQCWKEVLEDTVIIGRTSPYSIERMDNQDKLPPKARTPWPITY